MVSTRCFSNESSGASTAATPPCAQLVAASSLARLVTSSTSPCSAARSANDRPAMPEPRTRKSVVRGILLGGQAIPTNLADGARNLWPAPYLGHPAANAKTFSPALGLPLILLKRFGHLAESRRTHRESP